jgi:hypothetical protein
MRVIDCAEGFGGGGTEVVLPGKRGGGGVGTLDDEAAATGAAWLMRSDELTLIFGSSTGALEQPNTVQPPFSA